MSIEEMTPKEIRLEIARLKGYTKLHPYMQNPRFPAVIEGLEGYKPNGEFTISVPDWPNSNADALQLADEAPRYDITKMLSGRYEVVLRGEELHDGSYQSTADSLPAAICRAWLTWKGTKTNER